MIALLQRVLAASVVVGGETVGAIGPGLLILLGIEKGDHEGRARRLASRVARYRCFPGEKGRPMDRSLLDTGGGALVVSQFTLCADTSKGLRPGFDRAAPPDEAEPLVEVFRRGLAEAGVGEVRTGRFRSHMLVNLTNEGPVTLRLTDRRD